MCGSMDYNDSKQAVIVETNNVDADSHKCQGGPPFEPCSRRIQMMNPNDFGSVGSLSDKELDELSGEAWSDIVFYMDRDIRERTHQELAPCSKSAFWRRYETLAQTRMVSA
jgi:hypothetical protein